MFSTYHETECFFAGDSKGVNLAFMLAAGVLSLSGLPFSAQAGCNTYYVSNTGNNANPGTKNDPWQSLSRAASATLNPCDTVYVRGGIYNEYGIWFTNSGTASQPIQILAYPGESPIVDGSGLNIPSGSASFGVKGNYVVLSGFEVRNGMIGVQFQGYYGILRNMNIHDMWISGIYFQGDYGLAENNTVSFTSLENAAPTSSFRANGGGWGTGISAARDPVDGVTQHTTLRGNTVHSVYGEGLSTFEADGTVIENNVVYDNWATNTYISDARNVIFTNNLVYATNSNAIGTRTSPPVLLTMADELASRPRSLNNVVVNNNFLNGQICAFCWTLVPNSGLIGHLLANNTLVNGTLALPTAGLTHQGSLIQNNIFYRNDGGAAVWTQPNGYNGVSLSNNMWPKKPPVGAAGIGDVVANPQLAQSSSTGPGQLDPSYFAVKPTSPALNKGTPVYGVTDTYLVTTSSNSLNIGAYVASPPPIQFITAVPSTPATPAAP